MSESSAQCSSIEQVAVYEHGLPLILKDRFENNGSLAASKRLNQSRSAEAEFLEADDLKRKRQ